MIVYCIPVVAPIVQAFGEYSQRIAVDNCSQDTLEGWSHRIGAVRQLKNNEEDAFRGGLVQTISCLFISAISGVAPIFILAAGLACMQMGASAYLMRGTDKTLLESENRFLGLFKQKLEEHVEAYHAIMNNPESRYRKPNPRIQVDLVARETIDPAIKLIKEKIEPMFALCRELFENRPHLQFTKKGASGQELRTDRLHELENGCDRTVAALEHFKTGCPKYAARPDLCSTCNFSLRSESPLAREADLFVNTVFVESV